METGSSFIRSVSEEFLQDLMEVSFPCSTAYKINLLMSTRWYGRPLSLAGDEIGSQ